MRSSASLLLRTPAASVLAWGWGVGAIKFLTLACPRDAAPAPGGKKMSRGNFNSKSSHPEPSTRCPQALAFPDQLYDAVFDGAQVTSKTPIRLYGGAILSEYCWDRLLGR